MGTIQRYCLVRYKERSDVPLSTDDEEENLGSYDADYARGGNNARIGLGAEQLVPTEH